MSSNYWQQQGKTPLFEDVVWSKPESKRTAGKLLIIGGNAHGFAAPADAYQQAAKAGAGAIRVALPDSLQKTVGTFLENAFFLPSTPSGSFRKAALAELLELANWADGVLLAGDLGRNSETAVLLESFLQKISIPAVLTTDAADYFYSQPRHILDRPNFALAVSLGQLQQLARKSDYPKPVRFQMDMLQLVEWLHEFTLQHTSLVITQHLEYIFVAYNGKVSTTRQTAEIWRLVTASAAAVWLIQQPNDAFKAVTTAVFELK